MGLFQLDRVGWAVREWDDALSRFNDEQRRVAVEVAQGNGWFDRAVFSLGKNPDEQRLYGLRFPLHHDATIRREASNNRLDPAWVAAEIRAESVFYPRARSGANAMGLMQILPGTGASVAASLGRPWGGADSLYDPDTNIVLGTAYLRQLLDKFDGNPWLASAAYNAGEAPVGRWLDARAVARSGFLDRDDPVQGDARICRPRACLQRDLRLAHQRQRGSRCPLACVAASRPGVCGSDRRDAAQERSLSGGSADGADGQPTGEVAATQ